MNFVDATVNSLFARIGEEPQEEMVQSIDNVLWNCHDDIAHNYNIRHGSFSDSDAADQFYKTALPLEASKITRRMQREEFGEPSDAGRKVDCVFMFDGIELSNIELKSQNPSPRDFSVQLRKNIRLARCIQGFHLSFGMDEAPVIMGDVDGFGRQCAAITSRYVLMYYVDKNFGTMWQYWGRRRIESERPEKEAKVQTAITVNRTTARVMQSVEKHASVHLEKIDDSVFPSMLRYYDSSSLALIRNWVVHN
ncbi:hypothetical protein BGZ58_005267 [Dissophora ornata]|nr:hypothetical protein BGZ58_005267 [Dissophora ornata]